MPLEGINLDAVEQSAGQQMAQEYLVDTGRATGANAAREVVGGRPVTRFGTTWDEVQSRLGERFPNLNTEQARAVFENTRDAAFEQQLLKPPGQGQGERNELTQYMQHIPLARHFYNIQQAGEQRQVRNRIEAGIGSQRDYFDYQARLRNERYQADRGNVQSGLETMSQIPAFGAEMLMAAPFAEAAVGAVGMPLGTGATSLLGRAGQAAPGWLAGEAVRAAAMPANAASSIFQRINPHVGEADATAVDVFHGYLDHQIEIASESLGGPMTSALGGAGRGLGGMISRLPGGARAAAVASGLTQWATNKLGTTGFQNRLRQMGFDGLLGEFLEERVGEVARGATGVESDYGMTGGLAAGARGLVTGSPQDRQRFGEALNQLAQEGLAFGGYSAITGLIGTASARQAQRALQGQGLSAAQAQAQISQTVTSVLNNPASVATTPPGPLQQLAQQVAQQTIQHQAAQGPQPGIDQQAASQPAAQPAQSAAQESAQTLPAPAEAQTAASPAETPQPTPQTQQTAAVQGQETTPAASQTATPAETAATPAETSLASSPVESPTQTQTGSKRATQSDFAALKMAAQSAGVSAKGSAKSIQSRLEKVQAGREALKKLGQYRSLLEATKQMPDRTMPVPEDFAKAIASSGTLHASEKSALGAVL